MQDTSCVPHAWSYTSVPCQGSHSVQQGRIEAALDFVWVSLQTMATDSEASTDTSLKSRSREQRMGTFSTAQTAGARFCPQPRGQRTPSAPCWVHLQPWAQPRSKRISQRELLLSFTAEKLEGQKTQFVTHSWLPAGHSLLLHLLQHSAQAGSFSADCALERGRPFREQNCSKDSHGTFTSTIQSISYSDQKIGRNETCAILDKVLRVYKPSKNRHQAWIPESLSPKHFG